MAIQTINIGNAVNDGLGDDLRTAFQKVNANFTELNSSLTVTASNAGSTGEGVFKQKVGANLEFKRLSAGTKILLDGRADDIIINNTQPDAFVRIDTESGVVNASNNINLTIQGGNDVSVTAENNVISINTVLDLNSILTNIDFGDLSSTTLFPTQVALDAANVDFGTIVNPGRITLNFGVL
jgi:hypothetical protein